MTRPALPWAFALMLATLPLVHVGTVRGPVRLILPDFLALAMGLSLLLRWRAAANTLARDVRVTAAAVAAVTLCVATAASSVLSLAWITPLNFQRWEGYDGTLRWLGTPMQRALIENIRLVQCVAALIVTLVLADTSRRLRAATTWYVAGATAAAIYGIYTWFVMVSGSGLPLLPGTFSYLHLKRTAATFPEPVAYGGFALTGLALTLWLFERAERRRPLAAALSVQLFAAITSLSTLLLLGVALLWLATLAGAQRKIIAGVTIGGMVAVLIVLSAVPSDFVRRAVNKSPLAASWLDRTTAWRAATAMSLAYPALGVGAGLYAYNQAPFLPPDVSRQYAGGRVNSIALEVAAESGLVGLLACSVLVLAASSGSARGKQGFAGLRGIVVLAVLAAGYYTSRYAFVWVFAALLIASGTTRPDEPVGREGEACAS